MHEQKVSLGCRRPGALTAGAQGANMAQREQAPISPSRRGARPLWASANDLLQTKALVLMFTTVLCSAPWVFLLFCFLFFFYGCSRGWGEMPHLNWEWFCCNSPQAGASLSCCWASAASEAVLRHWAISFIFLQHPFGVLPSASNDGVLAKPFVGAKPAEPSSHLYPAVSLSLSDQPQLIPLNFSELQLNLDIKSVENRSISSFVS